MEIFYHKTLSSKKTMSETDWETQSFEALGNSIESESKVVQNVLKKYHLRTEGHRTYREIDAAKKLINSGVKLCDCVYPRIKSINERILRKAIATCPINMELFWFYNRLMNWRAELWTGQPEPSKLFKALQSLFN
jgi:hypothetical protein